MLLATIGALVLSLQQEPSADLFQRIEGEWTVRGTFTSDGKEQTLEGSEVVERRMEGRWVVIEHKLDYGGRPYRGLCLMAFDPEKKQYTGTWMDGSSTTPGTFEGKAENGTVSMHATSESPATRGMRISRWVFENKDGDNRVVRVFGCEKGSDQEKQIAELHYTRRSVAK